MNRLSKRSRDALKGVHRDLIAVVELAIKTSPVDFVVLEGLRSKQRQEELVKQGASQTLNSRHLTGHAVDLGALVNGKIAWDWCFCEAVATAMLESAKALNVPLEWGGHWQRFKDGPHFQLPWEKYK